MALQLNQGEYGQVLRVNFGEDISTNTALELTIQPKHGASKTIVTGVALGTSNAEVGDDTFLANEFITYTLIANDLNFKGQFRMKGKATMSTTKVIISDYVYITVLD